MTSTNDGETWSEEAQLTEGDSDEFGPAVAVIDSGRVIIAWWASTERGMIQYRTSDDGGATWQEHDPPFDPDAMHWVDLPDLAITPLGAIWLIYNGHIREGAHGLLSQVSNDDGETWSPQTRIQDAFCCQHMAGTTTGLVLTWWQGEWVEEPFNYHNDDVWYRTSDDEGATWSEPVRYTMYPGADILPNVAGLAGGGFGLVWESPRRTGSDYTQEWTIWYGNPATHEDVDYPPYVVHFEHSPFPNPAVGDEVTVEAKVVDSDAVSAHVEWSIDGEAQPDVLMGSDDGVNFGASLGVLDEGVFVRYLIRAADTTGNVMRSFSRGFEVIPPLPKENDVLLVVDDQRWWEVEHVAPYYKIALDALGTGYDFWDTSFRGAPLEEDLLPYRDGVVVWSAPHYDPWLWRHPDPDRVTDGIAAFMDAGGSLFISGQQIAEHFRHHDPDWLAKYLHAKHSWCCRSNDVESISGEMFGEDLSFGLRGENSANNSYSPDAIRPVGGASPVLRYLYDFFEVTGQEADVPVGEDSSDASGAFIEDELLELLDRGKDTPVEDDSADTDAHNQNSNVAAIRARDGQSKLVYFAFNFESIFSASMREQVMATVMGWINPTCNGKVSTIDGTPHADVIRGTLGDDVIVGFGGADQISARRGNDTICGGDDEDIIRGGSGNDWIAAFGGDDTLLGGGGRDEIHGGRGRDLLEGGGGGDRLMGGPGRDGISGGRGDDTIIGGRGGDKLSGNPGDDLILGGPGRDRIKCGGGFDIARGGGGRDRAAKSCEVTHGIP